MSTVVAFFVNCLPYLNLKKTLFHQCVTHLYVCIRMPKIVNHYI